MNLLKQDERLGRFTSSLYICHTKAMTAPVQYTTRVCIRLRTVATKSSIGWLYVCAGGLERLCREAWKQKLYLFIVFHISIWGAWSFVWGSKPTKAPPWPRDWSGYYFLLCPNRSVCLLIKSEKFSFSEMLRKELYLWTLAQKLYCGWMSTMTSSNESSWKLPPPKWRAGCAPVRTSIYCYVTNVREQQ